MSATQAARSLLRSTAVRTPPPARLAAGSKTVSGPGLKPFSSPSRMSKKSPLSHRIFRTPAEMSCCVETMLPYHTATASALLTSMLSFSPRCCGWTLEGQSKPR